MDLELLKFIRQNDNWEDLLSKEPYYLNIARDKGYIIFKYNQVLSDFSLDVVRESRGIILEDKTYRVVCLPFFKFFNVDEPNASKIDWSSAKVEEKIDGSLIKVWYDKGSWKISTNGTIDAFSAELSNNVKYETFGELFLAAVGNKFEGNSNYTYMFELVSPYNKVVVDYPEIKAYHIGTRDNITGKEIDIDIGYDKPKRYNLKTKESVKEAASKLQYNEEGYVVVDKYYNRVKIKSPAYVNAHRLINNNCINKKRVLELILQNEQSEFLSYFPEYKEYFQKMENKLNLWKSDLSIIEKIVKDIKSQEDVDMKEFARFCIDTFKENNSFGFSLIRDKVKDVNEYIANMTVDKIIERIGNYV